MVVDLMGVAADDLKGSELGMADLNVSRCRCGGRDPCLCRRRQHDQPDSRRELLVAPGLGEGVLIPSGQAGARSKVVDHLPRVREVNASKLAIALDGVHRLAGARQLEHIRRNSGCVGPGVAAAHRHVLEPNHAAEALLDPVQPLLDSVDRFGQLGFCRYLRLITPFASCLTYRML